MQEHRRGQLHPLLLAHPEENSDGGRGDPGGVNRPCNTDQKGPKGRVLDGVGGAWGGSASRIIIETYLFQDSCSERCGTLAIRTLAAVWPAMRAPAMPNR